jgi:hypothetical protein
MRTFAPNLKTLLAVGGALVMMACAGEPAGPPGPPVEAISRELADALSPSVLASLNSAGQFETVAIDSTAGPQLSEAEAKAFAIVFARNYAVHARSYFEGQRLARIDFQRLTPCGRALYASSRARVSPQAEVHERNFIGPRWVIALCSAGEPQLSVAVAALAVEMKVKDGEFITFPGPHGNEFLPSGIPAEWDGALPVSPEQAAILAAKLSGHHVTKVPQLVLAGAGRIAFDAQWVISLDGPVHAIGLEATDRVFVGPRLDGKSSLGRSGIVVQLPNGTSKLAVGQLPPNSVMAMVRPDAEFAFGWRPRFTPIQGGGIIK